MDKIYEKLTLSSFKKISIFFLIVCDLLICTYLYQKVAVDREAFQLSLEIVLKANPEARSQLPPNFQEQLFTLLVNALITMLSLYLCYHFLVYYLWHIKKVSAGKYIRMVSWVAAPLAILFALTNFLKSPLHALMALTAGVLYLFVALGTSYFPESVIPRKSVK